MVLSKEAGKATLLLLPGLLCDRAAWEPQIAEFSADYSLVVADFRGLDSFEAMAARVLDLAPERFAMAGHSMGGRVALEVMRQAADRVERLALLSTGVHPLLPGEAEKRQALIDLAWRDGIEALARAWIPPVLHPDHRTDRAMVEELVAMWCRSTPADHEGQIRAALNRRDATPLLPYIRCPTLVLGGADDPWAPVPQQREIAAAIPGAVLAIIPSCGHMVTIEQPEQVNGHLRSWLTG
jgi:pimeloyl-ACP methyl ester carboxylesterase